VCASVCVCVYDSESERERERARVRVCVHVRVHKGDMCPIFVWTTTDLYVQRDVPDVFVRVI